MNRYLEVLNELFDKVVIALNDKEGRAEVHVVDLVKQDEISCALMWKRTVHCLMPCVNRDMFL